MRDHRVELRRTVLQNTGTLQNATRGVLVATVVVRHLLLEAMHLLLVASLLLVVRPGAPFVVSLLRS